MWARRAAAGQWSGHGPGGGVFKFLPNASNRLQLDIEILPKVTERSLNITFRLIFRGNNTNASNFV